MSHSSFERSETWKYFATRISLFCNRFNAVTKSERFLEYILVVLFWKFASDWWREEIEGSLETSDAVDTRLRLASSRFFILPGASFYDVLSQCGESDIGAKINQALEKISLANQQTLGGVFKQFDFTSEQDIGPKRQQSAILSDLLRDFNEEKLDMRPSVVSKVNFGELAIFLMSLYYSGYGKTTHDLYTNDDIARIMAKLSQPEIGNTICDPVCGTGSLLIRASQEVDKSECQLVGQEKDVLFQSLARLNMIFHGVDDSKIYVGDIMRPSAFPDIHSSEPFDRIVADPPLNGFQTGLAATTNVVAFDRGVSSPLGNVRLGGNSHLAFLDMLIRMTKPKVGKIVVNVPLACLYKSKEEWMFRRQLVEENLLDAVISLPGKKSSESATAILVIDRSRESGGKNSRSSNVMFLDTREHFNKYYEENRMDFSHVEAVMTDYYNRTSIPKFAYNASIDEIEQNNFDLTVTRYVKPANSELKNLIAKDRETISRLKKRLTQLDSEIYANIRLLQKGDNL